MRNRNMYYATGLPGWMRFGYSPGWGGMPPCAPYIRPGMGQPPAVTDHFAQGQWPYPPPVQVPGPWAPYGADPEFQRQMLAQQLEAVSNQLAWIADQVAALEETETAQDDQ